MVSAPCRRMKDDALAEGRVLAGDAADDLWEPRSGTPTPRSRTQSLESFDVAVIAVPTPLHEGIPNILHIILHVEGAARIDTGSRLRQQLPDGESL